MALTTTNLVSYWKLDDNEANTDILDAHSTYDGTLGADTNTKDETGKIGTALNFSSVHANMGASDGLASSDFSISFWVNISSVSGSNRYYLTQGNSTTTDKIMHCVIDSDGYPYLGFYDDDVSTTTTKVSTGWNHLLYTHDTSTKLSSFYLNGAAAGSGTHSNAFTGTSNTYLGGFYNGWGGAGILDEVAIWKGEILSLAEAQDLYNSGDGLAYPFTFSKTINEGHISDDGSKQFLEYTKDISESSTLTDGIVVTSTGDAISSSFDFNNGIITTAKLTATESVGTGTYYLSADGGVNWELVTNGTTHTFTNTGTDLRWKAKGNAVTITRLVISDYR